VDAESRVRISKGGIVTTAIPTKRQEQPPDFDALEADVEKLEGELLERQQRLSPESLVDPAVRAELQDVESQLAATAAERRRIGDARAEGARRVQEAEQQAEAYEKARGA
jgi:hypothetical protein